MRTKSGSQFVISASVAGAALLFSASAFATTINPGDKLTVLEALRIAYEAGKTIHSEIEAGDTRDVAKQSLDIQVAAGVQALRDVGKAALADKYEREWKEQMLPHLDQDLDDLASGTAGIQALELGDHPPLSPWLGNFYDKLNQETHGLIKSVQIVDDINTMNYALAIVLFPNGSWRTHTSYDRIEYRKHFIPFADIVTYWGTLEGCDYYLNSQGLSAYKDVCSYGADFLEQKMGRYVAPVLSDEVWHLATGEAIPPLPVPPHPEMASVSFDEELSLADFQNAVMSHFSNH